MRYTQTERLISILLTALINEKGNIGRVMHAYISSNYSQRNCMHYLHQFEKLQFPYISRDFSRDTTISQDSESQSK